MRLDLFLKSSRLVPRRSLAQEFIKAGRITVNGSPGKAGRDVGAGDTIEIRKHSGTTVVRVREIPDRKQFSKKEAPELYELISETPSDESDLGL
ncbi:MAG: RNA-binding S4 domain-containing protein [Acidobacteriota bacterium]|nr:MAG: RNA-binding S4 domain-containing protein [Acidobacteriota bacterium]